MACLLMEEMLLEGPDIVAKYSGWFSWLFFSIGKGSILHIIFLCNVKMYNQKVYW